MSLYNTLLNTHHLRKTYYDSHKTNSLCPKTNYSDLINCYFIAVNYGIDLRGVFISELQIKPYLHRNFENNAYNTFRNCKLRNHESFNLYTSQG